MGPSHVIRIRGARQNNLKNLDLDLPLGEMIVVTGVSGSGKSSLVFDTLYAEGQRRYVETFSAYARQFLDRMDKPQVDRIDGVPPAIAIDQSNPVRTSRSTVGTMTELTDHFKLLYARVADLHCRACSAPIKRQTAQGIAALISANPLGSRVEISFPVATPESLPAEQVEQWLSAQGFTRIQSRNDTVLFVMQDRLVLRDDTPSTRVNEALEAAMRFGHGRCRVVITPPESGTAPPPLAQTFDFSSQLACTACAIQYSEPRPALFSFNSPIGACDTCRGFGRVIGIDAGLVIPDERKTLAEGAIKPWTTNAYQDCQKELLMHAKRQGVATDIAWKDLPPEHQAWVFQGDDDWSGNWTKQWYGVHRFFDYLEGKSYKMHVRVLLSRYRSYTECQTCHGARLKPEALLWTIQGHNVHQVMCMSIDQAFAWINTLSAQVAQSVDPAQAGRHAATTLVVKEIHARLKFLVDVGLGYLTLDRQSRTLSGGEVQRINLTTALGTSLVNTLFVLDEPSIGLHPRDLNRIIRVMHQLRDAGNTLVVVEHDPLVMAAADRIIDIGPGPGEHGGSILFNGPFASLLKQPTLTAQYLRGELQVNAAPTKKADSSESPQLLSLAGVTANNLKNIDLKIPLGQLVCITGVSGSGKSTLVQDVLYPALCKAKGKSTEAPGAFRALTGAELINDVILVDQSPIGKTTRSNPAVYVGAFDAIRAKFANASLSKQRGYTAGTFSFNAGDGRCATCGGNGFEHVEMQFLSDVYLRCPDCDGKRFRPEILEVTVNAQSIADVLEMTVTQALLFFEGDAEVARRLKPLADVGLSYLRLGQPVPTLSGGEAQRLKIAGQLAQAADKKIKGALLIFDEPTTGLHFEDIAKLLRALVALQKAGHSLLIIEHNLDVIASADWIIDLGPEAGDAGGAIVVEGSVATVMACAESHTGVALCAATGLMAEDSARKSNQAAALPSLRRAHTQAIEIHGAREHNLKNIQVNIPREQMTVITGVSGSGKSTLAFDILFAEGQRRYLESLNAYARQFVQPAARPEVDAVFGIPPTVAIEQRTSRGGRKSTVGTLTEIHHFLRLLFVKTGVQYCPSCDIAIEPQSVESIFSRLMTDYRGQHIGLMAPLVVNRKGIYQDLAKWAASKGHTHLRVDGQFVPTQPFPKIDRFKEHSIDLPIGDVLIAPNNEAQLKTLLDTALNYGQGVVQVVHPLHTGDDRPLQSVLLSTKRACPSCGTGFAELDPRLFSYNSKHGWCSGCFGTGVSIETFDAEQTGEEEAWQSLADTQSGGPVTCPSCDGARLNDTALAVRVNQRNIAQLSAQAVGKLPSWLSDLKKTLSVRDRAIGLDLISEIQARLEFLTEVGLGYLSLDRAAPTLSGGEAQRIRLAAQLGSNLQGVCYILDEPTIGLHPKDNQALLRLLTQLKNKGNTLVIVEHDEDTIRLADHLIDIGPGAGRLGGEVVAQGSRAVIEQTAASLTGRYLREPIAHSLSNRRPDATSFLQIKHAGLHNLKSVSTAIPLHRLTVITGVSGSGKSSLARDVLLANLLSVVSQRRQSKKSAGSTDDAKGAIRWQGCQEILGWESIDRVLEVDQTPIGKTPRSTPATYIGFWDNIRALLADSEESKMRGWKANRFSFNTGDGRCKACEGQGWQTIEMNFLPDVRVLCDACQGTRFNPETRNALWRGKSVADVLAMNVDQAVEFFDTHSPVKRPLQLLQDVGLGYLTLGQPSPTLSGGEAQRIKLVTELAKSSAGVRKTNPHTLYVLDEPTVGLHMADIEKLIQVLHRLVDAGNTVVVIEHQLDIWAQADWIIDMGPEGGEGGGTLVGAGRPAEILKLKTHTAKALRDFLKGRTH